MKFNEKEVRKEYYSELEKLTKEFAKKYKLKVDTLAAIVSDEEVKGVSEQRCLHIIDAWSDCALQLAQNVGDKYHCWIEHEETLVTITPFNKKSKGD